MNATGPEILRTLPQIARGLGINETTLRGRLDKAGVLPDFLVEAPLRGSSPLFRLGRVPELARSVGLPLPPHPIA